MKAIKFIIGGMAIVVMTVIGFPFMLFASLRFGLIGLNDHIGAKILTPWVKVMEWIDPELRDTE